MTAGNDPLRSFTLGDYSSLACPWCAREMRLDAEDVKDGNVLDCRGCDRPVRLGVDWHATIRAIPERAKPPPAWLKPGARVDYHAPIGGPVAMANAVVRLGPYRVCDHWSVWLEGKASGVDVEACTPARERL